MKNKKPESAPIALPLLATLATREKLDRRPMPSPSIGSQPLPRPSLGQDSGGGYNADSTIPQP